MIYRSLLRPIMFRLPPETVHELVLHSLPLALGWRPIRKFIAGRTACSKFGSLDRFGLTFANPVGLAAGFDKNGTAAAVLAALGFGFIEVGTVTNEAQPGNPRPRLFRLPRDRALINRAGFNNCGAIAAAENVGRHRSNCIVGMNIGKSRSVPIEDAIADYLASFEAVSGVADYVAVNVSSPNTPKLRELQRPGMLSRLLASLQQRNQELARQSATARPRPLLLKIAPDLDEAEIEAIVDVALKAKISGIIATNTTVRRDGLRTPEAEVEACGEGGLSGAPLQNRSNEVIALVYRLTRGSLPIIGVGGIFTPEDAWQKICAGASLIQLYTGFIYEGPRVAKRINSGLAKIMEREGFETLDDAVGSRAEEFASTGTN